MVWAKGQSGNPSGRSKKRRDIEALAQKHTDTAVKALFEVAAQDEDLRARVAAAVALLDRGYGKPAQRKELSGPDGGPIQTQTAVVKVVQIPDNGRNGSRHSKTTTRAADAVSPN